MYRGYKLSKDVIKSILQNCNEYSEYYRNDSKNVRIEVKNNLEKFLIPEKKIDVEALQKEWFPIEAYDIFISHSHRDLKEVEALAGYLSREKKLKVFVDSFIWNYSKELLHRLNIAYNSIDSNTYKYTGTNWCCTNITLILHSALQEVIDKSEVLFFYNSPNSVTHEYNEDERSDSPWIYSELLISKYISKKDPRKKEELYAESGMEGMNTSFSYIVTSNHLEELKKEQFDKWCAVINCEHALDDLYNLLKYKEKIL